MTAIDDWRKTIIYIAVTVPMFLQQLVDVFTILAGGLFRVVSSCKPAKNKWRYPSTVGGPTVGLFLQSVSKETHI